MNYDKNLVMSLFDAEVAIHLPHGLSDHIIMEFQEALDEVRGEHVMYSQSLQTILKFYKEVVEQDRRGEEVYLAEDNWGSMGFCYGKWYEERGYSLVELNDVLNGKPGQNDITDSDFDGIF